MTTNTALYCTQCGQGNRPEARFCWSCGQQIVPAPALATSLAMDMPEKAEEPVRDASQNDAALGGHTTASSKPAVTVDAPEMNALALNNGPVVRQNQKQYQAVQHYKVYVSGKRDAVRIGIISLIALVIMGAVGGVAVLSNARDMTAQHSATKVASISSQPTLAAWRGVPIYPQCAVYQEQPEFIVYHCSASMTVVEQWMERAWSTQSYVFYMTDDVQGTPFRIYKDGSRKVSFGVLGNDSQSSLFVTEGTAGTGN